MPYSVEGKLVVAISSRALFDFEDENRVFENEGESAYIALQYARLDVPARDLRLELRVQHRLRPGEAVLHGEHCEEEAIGQQPRRPPAPRGTRLRGLAFRKPFGTPGPRPCRVGLLALRGMACRGFTVTGKR